MYKDQNMSKRVSSSEGTVAFILFQALELAALATEACQFKDWWWKVQLAKCYYRYLCTFNN